MNPGTDLELSELSKTECLELLGSVATGRLSATRRALPVIVPVWIHVQDSEIVLESLLGDTVALTTGSVVALETGTIGDGPAGWTVQVCGILGADGGPPSVSSADGLTTTGFRLSTDVMSGWRATATCA